MSSFPRLFRILILLACALLKDAATDDVEHIVHLTEGEIPKVTADNDFVLLLFSEEDGGCSECDAASEAVERIIIPGVKKYVTTSGVDAGRYLIPAYPSLVYYRQQKPIFYDGGAWSDPTAISEWMTSVSTHRSVPITTDTFHENVHKSLMFFHKPECPDIASIMETVAHKLKDSVTVGSVNLGVESRLEQPLGISACPQLLFFRDGAILRFGGETYTVEAIMAFVAKNLDGGTKAVGEESIPDVPKRSVFNRLTDFITYGILGVNTYVKISILLLICTLIAVIVIIRLKNKAKRRRGDHFHFE